MCYASMYARVLVLAILAATSARAGAQTAAPVRDEEEGALGQVGRPVGGPVRGPPAQCRTT